MCTSTERRAPNGSSDGEHRQVLEGDEQPQYSATLRRLQQRCRPAVPGRHLHDSLRPHDTTLVGDTDVLKCCCRV